MAGQRSERHGRQEALGRWMLVALIALAFALRVYELGSREFWFDEALSANISKLGWEGAVSYLRNEPFEHPPLYYLLLYPWQQVAGSSEYAFRFFSVFWGVLFVPLLYILVRRLAEEHVGQIAALLGAISPFLIAYSQDARMYSLLPCLTLLTLLSFRSATAAGDHLRRWLVYALLLGLGIATHYFFVFVLLAITVYMLVEKPVSRRVWLLAMGIQLSVLVALAVWLILAPGLRSSLVRLAQGEAAFGLDYKLDKILPTLVLSEIDAPKDPLTVYLLAMGGWVLTVLGVWWSRRSGALGSRSWRLLALALVIPLAISFVVPYGVLGRHLSYTLVAILPFMALALVGLSRRGNLWLGAGILILLLPFSYGLAIHYTVDGGSLGQALSYIGERHQPGDLLVIPQPNQKYLMDYYNRASWPALYLPETGVPLTPRSLDDLQAISQTHSRLWLGPIGAWTADPDSLVEQWLAANTFQADKAWFPDSSSVGLYFTGEQDLAPVDVDRLTWGGLLRLRKLQASSLHVAPGDAVRLGFEWRAGRTPDQRYVVSLAMVDEQGVVWAERRSEPCAGWCPTDKWVEGQSQRDRHALYIPPGTPPGIYRLQVSWAPVSGGSPLLVQSNGEWTEQATVAEVTVTHPATQSEIPTALPNRLNVTFGNALTLLGYDLAASQVTPGEAIDLETYWRAEVNPGESYRLLFELVDNAGSVVTHWEVGPCASFYPTGAWRAGEYLRGQQRLPMPGSVLPGQYELRLALVSPDDERMAASGQRPRGALGGLLSWREQVAGDQLPLALVQVFDRPRQFTLPEVPHALEATVGKRARLVGYDLDLSQAHPGGQISLTLYWVAEGPLVRPFKVFTHLVDAANTLLAQDDAPPGGGCCPADTWVKGEVLVDPHIIPLGADLLPGTYRLETGLYDPDTASRLPAYDAKGAQLPNDLVPIKSVSVKAQAAAGQQTATPADLHFEFNYSVLVPFVSKEWP
jgi:4-amino-4-deoxy-L-arabinose transferase-like glycosyltransferase